MTASVQPLGDQDWSYDRDVATLMASVRFVNVFGHSVPTPMRVVYHEPVLHPAQLLSQSPEYEFVSGDGTVRGKRVFEELAMSGW